MRKSNPGRDKGSEKSRGASNGCSCGEGERRRRKCREKTRRRSTLKRRRSALKRSKRNKEKQNKEYAEKEEAKRQEDLAIENKNIELAQEQLREERQSREAAGRRRNEEREIERLRQAENDSLIAKMKKIGDAMKHVLPRMPNDIMEVPLYFETVENAFRSFEVDRRYWVKLLLPLMTQRARTVINRVTLADRDNYATVKEQLLKEFNLTPREYRSKFMEAKKTAEETYTMFTARLKNLLNYYVKSRQVNDNYESLFDRFISDKLKESLPPGPLQFVLSKEGTECFKASMIADLADIHTNNRIGMPSYSKQSYGSILSDKKNSSEMDSDFQINDIKDRRITTGRVNQKEILQREGHMRIRTRNKLGGEHQRIKESLNLVHQEDLVVDIQGQMMT